MKSWSVRWAVHVASLREQRNVCRECIWKLGIREPLGKPVYLWDYNVGMDGAWKPGLE
jgi:hypothetical protein